MTSSAFFFGFGFGLGEEMAERMTAADDDNSGPQRSTKRVKHYCYGNAII